MRVIVLLALVAVAAAAIQGGDRQILNNRKVAPNQWKMVGVPFQNEKFSFVLGLKQRNLDQLESLFWQISTPGSPKYRQFMTNNEILDLIAPPVHETESVLAWLQSFGKMTVENRGDNLKITTDVATTQRIFDTTLYLFKHHKKSVNIVRSMGTFSLPKDVLKYVELASGISDFPMIDVDPKIYTSSANGVEGIVPESLFYTYKVPANTTAPSTSQGVIEFNAGQYFSPSSLQTFAKDVGIDVTPLEKKHIITPQPPVGIEGTLDIQYIATVGQQSVNWYWTEANWLYEWATTFSAATDKPEIVSISYGWSEAAQCQIAGNECSVLGTNSEGYVARVNTEFQKIGVQGVSILCASGDSGANGRTDPSCTADKLRPAFPAASPYLTAVGATQLNGASTPLPNAPAGVCQGGQFSCNVGGTEEAVSYQIAHFTSGGGFSNYAPRPSYQDAAVKSYLNSGVSLPPSSYYNASNRGFPDVASLGTGIVIYSQLYGGLVGVGGTSASSPSFAGYMTLLNEVAKSSDGKPLGFLNPLLYKMAADQPDTFKDITKGDNKCTESGCAAGCKGYEAAAGWDPVTGLGGADVTNMLSYVQKNLKKFTPRN